MCGVSADLTIDFADEFGESPGDKHVMRLLEAGKRVLTEVRREKNNLQDAERGTKRRSSPACRLREGEKAASARHFQ